MTLFGQGRAAALKKRIIPSTYDVYFQAGQLIKVGTVDAFTGEEAIKKAREKYKILAPVVQRQEQKRKGAW